LDGSIYTGSLAAAATPTVLLGVVSVGGNAVDSFTGTSALSGARRTTVNYVLRFSDTTTISSTGGLSGLLDPVAFAALQGTGTTNWLWSGAFSANILTIGSGSTNTLSLAPGRGTLSVSYTYVAPEPAAASLCGLGLAGLLVWRRRRVRS
jgi:hypothetical protein